MRCLRIAFSLASVFWACALRIWISPSNVVFAALAARLVVDDGVRARFELRLRYRRHLGRGDEPFRGVARHLLGRDFSGVKNTNGFGTSEARNRHRRYPEVKITHGDRRITRRSRKE